MHYEARDLMRWVRIHLPPCVVHGPILAGAVGVGAKLLDRVGLVSVEADPEARILRTGRAAGCCRLYPATLNVREGRVVRRVARPVRARRRAVRLMGEVLKP